MLEINLLRYLTTFAKYGTLSAASKKLYISQSALSRAMQKLEEIFGVELFIRKKIA